MSADRFPGNQIDSHGTRQSSVQAARSTLKYPLKYLLVTITITIIIAVTPFYKVKSWIIAKTTKGVQ